MSGRAGAGAACAIALAAALLEIARPAPSLASPCPNAQFRSGPSEHLPDCRAYEQVSPAQKGGLDAVTLEPMQPAQSAACEPDEACTIAYMNVGASFAGALGNEFANAYLASRGPAGWQTTPLSPPTPQAPASSTPQVTYAFASDLSQAVLRVPLQQLTDNAPSGVYNLFLREPSGAYSLVTASAPAEPPEPECGGCFEEEDVPAFAGASDDFSHIIFEANDRLVEGAPGDREDHVENLYEEEDEHVRLVGILPDGTIPQQGASAGGGIAATDERTGELEHAISQNGSRILFEAASDGGPAHPGGPADPAQAGDVELYDRIDGSSTLELSAPAPGARPGDCETEGGLCSAEPASFWGASADGSVVYFTSRAALTKGSFTGPEETAEARRSKEEELGEPIENQGNDLYRYDLDTGTLTDLTADADNSEDPAGASVLGVVGMAEDGSYVYFVAEGHLGEGAPAGLAPHLYVWHETSEGAGAVQFIATLAAPSEREEKNIESDRTGSAFPYRSDILDWSSDPRASQAYVTPDGRHLAFMSIESLTGYENRQRVGEGGREVDVADHEVFLYSAQTGQLVCASCDPSDAQPLGSAFIGASLSERASTPFHQPRSLSDDGSRLFFTSPDPLVPGLAGGTDKLFEYEDGGVQLISGTESGTRSVFLDASASGNDVFFATRERLAPTDTDELLDVYDARVDGGLPAPAAPITCEGGPCLATPGSPPVFATPSSASFTGAGNLAPPPPVKPSRKQLLAKALAGCRKLKFPKKRAACIVAANRRYAPKAKRARRAAAESARSR